MPFPVIWGIPKDTPVEVLLDLRREIVEVLVKTMTIPSQFVHVFFSQDLLGDNPPQTEEDGSTTIYISLDTAMFHGRADDDNYVHNVLFSLTGIVWEAFERKYEVEAFIGDLNPRWKCLMKSEM